MGGVFTISPLRGDRECVRYVPVCAGNNGGQEDLEDKAYSRRWHDRRWGRRTSLICQLSMYHVQLSEFPPCHTGPFLSFSVSLFLHRDKTDRPRWIAKLRESESTMTPLVKLMWSGRACTLPELLATQRVLDESVVTGSELTVVLSIHACLACHTTNIWWVGGDKLQAYTDDCVFA